MKKMKTFKLVSVLGLLLITACGEPSYVKNVEFNTITACLAGIKIYSGQTLQIITDRPDMVSGFLADGRGFGCQLERSGTKGTYVKGWWEAKPSSQD